MGVLIITYDVFFEQMPLSFTNTDRYMSELLYVKFLSDLGSFYIPYKVILN